MNNRFYDYETIVIGGGLSGSQAAVSSAGRGSRTLLISINMDTLGWMQFSNLFNWKRYIGLSKGSGTRNNLIPQIIKKHSLLMIDENSRFPEKLRGSTVIDRKRSALAIKSSMESFNFLETRQGLATDIIKNGNGFNVVTSDSLLYFATAVVVCTGTYLDARIKWGKNIIDGGRPGEIRSVRLLENLKRKGIVFYKDKMLAAPKVIIVDRESSIYGPACGIEVDHLMEDRGQGDKKSYKEIYLLPEGKETKETYVYGFENNLEEEEQLRLLSSAEKLKYSYMVRPGYEVEFAAVDGTHLTKDFSISGWPGLYFAGRVAGAKTYEESLAQGYKAGLEAGRR